MIRTLKLVLAFVATAPLLACAPSNHGQSEAILPAQITTVSRDTYLSGDQFCSTYSAITSKEFGLRVKVPRDYKNPSRGSLTLYAYTLRPFDPKKPSYIYVDGGPGQNTHGEMPEVFGGRMNEIRFDQRGLGCSSPESFDLYQDASLYSSENTIRDMDEIRKAYGIAKWSVYGLSYGTVPATMYGSRYAAHTASIVLEGVIGDTALLESQDYSAEKLNLILTTLNEDQRQTFSNLMFEESTDRADTISLLTNFFYYDRGMRTAARVLSQIITTDGILHRDFLHKATELLNDSHLSHPQQPGAVDTNILIIIYCKNLGKGAVPEFTLGYSDLTGFVTRQSNAAERSSAHRCADAGVSDDERRTYRPANFKTQRPVYYFQGSHDGATQASGAFAHWSVVPQGASYFLLANKGGHNPNLTRLNSTARDLRTAETALFLKAIAGRPIAKDDVANVNQFANSDQTWFLYLTPPQAPQAQDELDSHLDGIKLVR